MGKQLDVAVRLLIRRDMTEVLAIESACFEFPWDDEDFWKCLRQRNCIGMVAEHEKDIVGFMVYELHKHTLRIVNFAVKTSVWRRGVGHQMVDKLIDKLTQQRRTKIIAYVRDRNPDAQLFFARNGFRAVGWDYGYYENGEDAIQMEYSLLEDDDSELWKPGTNRVWKFIERKQ